MIGTPDEAKLLKVLLVVALSIKTGISLMGIEAKYIIIQSKIIIIKN